MTMARKFNPILPDELERDFLSHKSTIPFPLVIIHGAMFQCTHCGYWKPASDFGMLNDRENGALRNQPQCRRCRSRYGSAQLELWGRI